MWDLPRARGLRQAHLFGAARVCRSGLRHCILPLLRRSLFRNLGALARKLGMALRFGLLACQFSLALCLCQMLCLSGLFRLGLLACKLGLMLCLRQTLDVYKRQAFYSPRYSRGAFR